MKGRELLDRYRKDPRVIVAVPLLVLAATSLIYYAIQRAKELSTEALSSQVLLFVLWNINLLLILGIVFVLLRGIAKLVLERQRGIIGSRFRTKLVVTYMLMSLVPVGVLFFVATDLLRVSIDRWFNTPVRRILQNGRRSPRWPRISPRRSLPARRGRSPRPPGPPILRSAMPCCNGFRSTTTSTWWASIATA